MGRKIILLSDGTGNSAAKVWRTNVWRTFEALDLSGNDQIAYYDDGVGTSSFRPWALLGGVFGFGLKRNVLALYTFACRNYRAPDDELFGFGFSRGAFTIRIVMGLILSEGLVQAETEGDLHRGAIDAYRAYRRKHFHTGWFGRPEEMFRNVRDYAVELWRRGIRASVHPAATARQDVKIHLIGVWDTVAAYGTPVDEMTRGISRWIWPLGLPNHRFDRQRVRRGCQALALDEERTTFHPELWNEKTIPPKQIDITKPRYVWDQDEQICQVWFTGVHANVGGGYPDDSLAYIPFVWMMTEAKRCGLKFKSDYANDPLNPDVMRADPDTFKNAIAKRDKDGRLYDPRKGFSGYYRYGPRKLVLLNTPKFRKNEDDEVLVERPKIHESVFKRIRNHAHAYAPIGLPAQYDIVTDAGEVLTPDQYRANNPDQESSEQAAQRAAAQEHVWNRVWWRKLVYFLTVGATLWLIALPFVDGADPNAETYSSFRWLSAIIRLIGEGLPGFASPWVEGYAREPVKSSLSALIVAGLLWLGTRVAGDIGDTMGLIWRRSPSAPRGEPTGALYRLRSREGYARLLDALKRSIAPAVFALLFVCVAIVGINKAAFVAYDSAGYTCIDAARNGALVQPRTVAMHETVSAAFDIRNLCNRTRIAIEGNGARYNIRIATGNAPEDQWQDGAIAVPPGGFSSVPLQRACPWQSKPANHLIVSPSWSDQARMLLWIPFRRIYARAWFHIVLRIGSAGAEEDYYRPDSDDCSSEWNIHPKRGGELFIYVNDAIVGIPKLYDAFYRNNSGKGTIFVKRY